MNVLPLGFLSQLDPPILEYPYFEIGLTEVPTGLTVSQCELLWDETSLYSLVSAQGVQNWYQAESDTTIYESLRTNNGNLTTNQMNAITDWLPRFRDFIVNKLAKEELSLPMEPYDLGSTIFMGLGAGGGVLALLGVLLLALSRRK